MKSAAPNGQSASPDKVRRSSIRTVIKHLEQIAPPSYQEGYDNSGLLVGDANEMVTGVLCCLDSTEAVVDEAIAKDCNLIVAHHPIIFGGLKRLTGRTYIERVVMKALRNNIAIYAIHTNLDNVYSKGVNAKIAEKLELKETRILAPKSNLRKLEVVVPTAASDILRKALFKEGAGLFNGFQDASYANLGVLTHRQQSEAAVKLEFSFPENRQGAILRAMHEVHPESSFLYELSDVLNANAEVGSGMIGQLSRPMKPVTFLRRLKKNMNVECVKHTALFDRMIGTVAVCGGAGGFLLKQAIAQPADVFVTSDYKYHEYFDADGKIIIADIGHYESEQFTIELLQEIISQKFSNFAAHCTTVRTNPVFYM